MFGPDPMMLTDEQKTRLRRLAWSAFRKFALSTVGAIGASLGTRAVEWVLDGDEDDDEEDED